MKAKSAAVDSTYCVVARSEATKDLRKCVYREYESKKHPGANSGNAGFHTTQKMRKLY